jgi:hypothetical protein
MFAMADVEGRRKKEEGRRKKEEGRRKKENAVIAISSAIELSRKKLGHGTAVSLQYYFR